MMKKFAILTILLLSTVVPHSFVYAEEVLSPVCTPETQHATACVENEETQNTTNNSLFGPNGVLTRTASLVATLVGVAAVIMIIIGGIQYVISAGDPTNVQNAKNTILYAIIGLVVALMARAIILFVLVRL
jgi:hypothetical protein